MKKTLSILLAVAMIFSLAACGSPKATPTPDPTASAEPSQAPAFDAGAAAEALAKQLALGEFEAAAENFSAEMLAQADADTLSGLWDSVAGNLGAFVAVNDKMTTTGSYLIYSTATAFCEFENGGLAVMTMFDGTGQTASLLFNPYAPVSQLNVDTVGTATPLLWEVTGPDGGKLYLFGSYHLAEDSMYALPDAVMDAYNESDAIAAEYDLFTSNYDAADMISLQMAVTYIDGTTAADHLTPETHQAAVDFLTSRGVYSAVLESSRLAQWSSYFTVLACTELGFDATLGIDMYMLNLAHSQGKPVLEVESQAFQLEMLNAPADIYYDYVIRSAVNNFDEGVESTKELYEAYRTGDLEKLTELITDTEIDEADLAGYTDEQKAEIIAENDAYNKALVKDRNVSMTETALAYLAGGDTVFFMVGAGHMVGDEGIAALLAEAGCTVTQVSY